MFNQFTSPDKLLPRGVSSGYRNLLLHSVCRPMPAAVPIHSASNSCSSIKLNLFLTHLSRSRPACRAADTLSLPTSPEHNVPRPTSLFVRYPAHPSQNTGQGRSLCSASEHQPLPAHVRLALRIHHRLYQNPSSPNSPVITRPREGSHPRETLRTVCRPLNSLRG